jgi:hypothetical protein
MSREGGDFVMAQFELVLKGRVFSRDWSKNQ